MKSFGAMGAGAGMMSSSTTPEGVEIDYSLYVFDYDEYAPYLFLALKQLYPDLKPVQHVVFDTVKLKDARKTQMHEDANSPVIALKKWNYYEPIPSPHRLQELVDEVKCTSNKANLEVVNSVKRFYNSLIANGYYEINGYMYKISELDRMIEKLRLIEFVGDYQMKFIRYKDGLPEVSEFDTESFKNLVSNIIARKSALSDECDRVIVSVSKMDTETVKNLKSMPSKFFNHNIIRLVKFI